MTKRNSRQAMAVHDEPKIFTRAPRRVAMADIKVSDETIVLSPREMVRKEFSQRLVRILQSKRWRQADLARKSGLGRYNVNGYIRGRMLPTPDNLKKLAGALGVDERDLMPSHVETAADRESPLLEMRQADTSGRVFIKVNQMVTLDQASKIFDVLKDANEKTAKRG